MPIDSAAFSPRTLFIFPCRGHKDALTPKDKYSEQSTLRLGDDAAETPPSSSSQQQHRARRHSGSAPEVSASMAGLSERLSGGVRLDSSSGAAAAGAAGIDAAERRRRSLSDPRAQAGRQNGGGEFLLKKADLECF